MHLPLRIIFPALLAAIIPATHASSTKGGNEIRVSLFGQPCLLNGPFEQSILKNIHSVSPEQLPGAKTEDQAQQVLIRVKAASLLPAALDAYKERIVRRMEALRAFHAGLASAQKSDKSSALLDAVRSHFDEKQFGGFESELKKLDKKGSVKTWNQAALDQLFDFYSDSVQPFPEEEFHRAIQKMNVNYTCSFEEDGEE